jgi:DNA-directed RNA polymerase specialized sigma24 family protein
MVTYPTKTFSHYQCFDFAIHPCLLRGAAGVSMNTLSGKNPAWWDQELDPTGKPIRLDVRSAAREVWNDACTQARALLGEPCEAAGLMERSVVQISRYLNRRGLATFSQDTSSLLMCAFCRALRRHVIRLRRIELAPDLSEASERPPTRSCTTEEDCRLDAEKAARQLSARGRQMYKLRHAGFEWKEIAATLNTTDAAARAEFSRELKRARLKLRKKCPTKTDPRDSSDSITLT